MQATAQTAGAATGQAQQYLTFSVDGAVLAVKILRIIEIIEFRALTPVPLMPSFVRGVLNLRGAVVPVVDLKARFGRGPAEVSRKTCVVIIDLHAEDAPASGSGAQDIGVMVDQVNAVVEIAPGDIEPPPSIGNGLRPDFISGMGKLNDGFVVILDLDNLLCVEELAETAAAATELGADAEVAAVESESGEPAASPSS